MHRVNTILILTNEGPSKLYTLHALEVEGSSEGLKVIDPTMLKGYVKVSVSSISDNPDVG